MRRHVFITAIVASAALLAPQAASAQLTLTGLSCNNAGAVAFMGATSCSGAYVGNDKNQNLTAALSAFGAGTLVERGASDDANNGPFTGNVGTTSGTLTFEGLLTGEFVVAIKTADAFSLYYFLNAGPGVNSINFTTIGTSLNRNGSPNGLSHASLYSVSGMNIVPEPSIYVLMATGLIGVTGIARRRRRQA